MILIAGIILTSFPNLVVLFPFIVLAGILLINFIVNDQDRNSMPPRGTPSNSTASDHLDPEKFTREKSYCYECGTKVEFDRYCSFCGTDLLH